jgi:hypothetical protein
MMLPSTWSTTSRPPSSASRRHRPRPLEIDATLAGPAFAAITAKEADVEHGRRLWLPLWEGGNAGASSAHLPAVDNALRVRCTWLATLVGELLMTRSQYTDAYFLARRRHRWV